MSTAKILKSRCFSSSKSRDTSVPDSGPTQIPPIIVADIEISEEDPPKTAVTLTEVTTESSDMAAPGNTSYTGRLKDEVKKKKKNIEELEHQLEDHKLNCKDEIRKLKDEIRKLKDEISKHEDEIKKLREENNALKQEQQTLNNSCQWLEEERNQEKKDRKSMETKLKCLTGKYDSMKTEYDAKLRNLSGNEDLLCLRQIGVDVQVQIYQYVMQGYFRKVYDEAKIAKLNLDFIANRIKDPVDKKRAEERLQTLKDKDYIKNALSHLEKLKGLKKIGNNVAHPELDEEKIEISISNLRRDNNLEDEMYEDVKELITLWKETKSL